MTQAQLDINTAGLAPATAATAQYAPATRAAVQLVPARLSQGALLVGPGLLLVLWEAASRLGWLSPETLTAPSQALVAGYAMVADGSLLPHLLASAGRAYSGLLLGVVAGVLLALARA